MAATPYQTVYDAFLSKVEEDQWDDLDSISVYEADWLTILEGALPYFKFPRISLERDTEGFVELLGNAEIQILATYMKLEWLTRTILTWENIRAFYSEADFSQANLLDKLIKLQEITERRADKLQHLYYRSIEGRPYPFSNLAGKQE